MTVKTYTNTASHSYDGNSSPDGSGALRSDKTNSLSYQGFFSGIGRGSQFSYVSFNGSQIATDLAGATISKVTIKITLSHRFDSSGNFKTLPGWSTRTSFPGTITSHTTVDHMAVVTGWFQSASDQGGGAVTTDITSWAAAAFQSGGANAIMFGNDSNNTAADYGYFATGVGAVTLQFTFSTAAAPTFANSTIPAPTVGSAYSTANTEATLGIGPGTYSKSAGTLPAGLSLNSTTGLLSGTPTTAGGYSFTVKVVQGDGQSATQAFSTTVNVQGGGSGGPPPLSGPYALANAEITAASTTSGAIPVVTTGYDGDTYCVLVSTVDSTTARAEVSSITDTQGNIYTLQALTGATGLSANPEVQVYIATGVNNLVAGTDTITVTLLRSLVFTVEAFGIVGGATIDKAVCATATSTAPSVTSGVLTKPFEYVFGSWTAGPTAAFSAPAGCTTLVNFATGTPSPSMQTYWDSPGTTTTASVTFSGTLVSILWQAVILTFVAPPPIFSTTSFGNGVVGSRYSSSAAVATISAGTTTYALTGGAGSLPPGVTLTAATGIVSGIPTTAGIFPFGITATDGNGNTANKSGTITIGPLVYGNGANDVLPTVPQFVQGETSVANLNNLGYATDFLCDDNTRPVYKAFKPFATTISTANTWTNVSGGNVAFDSDGQGTTGLSNMDVNITTTGYYCCEAAASIKSFSTSYNFKIRFLFTAGAPNPVYATGTTIPFGQRASGSLAVTGTDTALCASDICPTVCYPGDTIAMQVYTSNTNMNTLDFNNNAAFNQGRFVLSFSTYYLRVGG